MKIFEGKIVSTGMTNTIVVEIGRVTPHPLYKKLIKTTKKYKVDTNGFNDLSVGSVVEITETRPISKGKYFKVTGVAGAVKSNSKSVKTEEKVEAKIQVSDKKEKKVEPKTKAKKTAKKGSK